MRRTLADEILVAATNHGGDHADERLVRSANLIHSTIHVCDSLGSREALEPLGEKIAVRSVLDASRQDQATAVDLLQAMPEHRSILLFQDIAPNVNVCVGIDADDVR